MELSALLTKKALVAGGGTAAAATAIVVPVAFTQSGSSNETIEEEGKKGQGSSQQQASKTKNKKVNKPGEATTDKNKQQQGQITPAKETLPKTPEVPKKPEIPFKPINTTIPTLGSSLIQSFNKPGDCITRSLPDIEKPLESDEENKKGFFSRPDVLIPTKDPLNRAYEDIFLTTKWVDKKGQPQLTFACLTFSKPKDQNREFRVEIVIKNNTWAWLWMSGLKAQENETNKYDFYWREAALSYKQNKWNVEIGVDGKYERNEEDIAPKFTSFPFKEIKPNEGQECNENKTTCEQREFRTLFWLPNGKSGILPDGNDWSKSVLPLNGTSPKDYSGQHSSGKRSGVFGNNIWHSSNDTQKDTVKFWRSSQANNKGTWHNWVEFCNNTDNLSKKQSTYQTLCQ